MGFYPSAPGQEPNNSSPKKSNYQAPVVTAASQHATYAPAVATYDFLLPFDQLLQKANAGDPSAEFLVGRALNSGLYGLVVDKAEGRKWIQLAANNPRQGPASLCAQAYCLEVGINVIKNITMAKQYYDQSIAQGYIPARKELAELLYSECKRTQTHYGTGKFAGQSVTEETKDPVILKKIIEVLTPAAEAGYIPARTYLAFFYRNGYGVPKDEDYAFRLFEQDAASGYVLAKEHMGDYYYYGKGNVKVDIAKAMALYQECYEQGEQVLNPSFEPKQDKKKSCSIM